MGKNVCGTTTNKITNAFISRDGRESLSAVKTSRYLDFLDSLMSNIYEDIYEDVSNDYTANSFDNPASIRALYSDLKRRFINNKYYDQAPENIKEDLNLIYRNWDDFVKYHMNYGNFVRTVGDFEYTYSDTESLFTTPIVEENPESQLQEDDSLGKHYERKGNESSPIELISNEVKLLMRSLVKTEYDLKEDSFVEIWDENSLPQKVDFNRTLNLIINKTKGVRDGEEFIRILNSKELKNVVPEIYRLDRILRFSDIENTTHKQKRAINALYIVATNAYVPLFASRRIISEEENVHQSFPSSKGMRSKITNEFYLNFQNREITKELAPYIEEDTTTEETGGRRVFEYGNFRKRLIAVPPKLQPIIIDDADLETIPLSEIKKVAKNHFHFLNVIGINFSGVDLVETIEEKRLLIETLNQLIEFRNNLEERLKHGQYIFNPLKDAARTHSYLEEVDGESIKKFVPWNTLFEKAAVRFESEFSRISPSFMSKNAENENQSDLTLHNAFTIAMSSIINAKSEQDFLSHPYNFMKDVRNPKYRNSFIRRNILEPEDVPFSIRIGNYSGHEIVRGEESEKKTTSGLLPKNKFLSDYANLLIFGRVNTPQLERKSSYYFYEFFNKVDGRTILPIRTRAIEESFSSNQIFFQQVLNYLHGEVMRMKTYPAEHLNSKELNRAHQFAFMEDFLIELIKNNSDEYLEDILDINSSLVQDKIRPIIDEYFNNILNRMNDRIRLYGISDEELLPDNIFTAEMNEASKDLSLQEKRAKYKDAFTRAFIANSYIIYSEFTIFVSGEPIFIKDDFSKRMGGVASTGILPTTAEFVNDIFFYDDWYINHFNTYSLRGILNKSTGYDNQNVVDDSEVFTSAIIKEDINKTSAYTKPEIVKDFIESYKLKTGVTLTKEDAEIQLLVKDAKKGLKVGDGSGYINIDAYHRLSIRQNFFREEQLVVYEYEGLFFKKYILKEPLTQSEEIHLATTREKILQNPRIYNLLVLKESYFGPYGNTDLQIDGMVFDKFAIVPLLPSLAFGNPKMEKLLITMAKRQIGYVKYESSTKIFKRQVLTLDELDSTPELDLLFTEILKLQISPADKEKKDSIIPLQKIRLLFANLFDQGSPSSKNPKIVALRTRFMETLAKLNTVNKDEANSGLGIDAHNNWDLKVLVDKIRDQVNNQKLPSSYIEDAMELTESGEFKYFLESSGISKQVVNYVLGYIDKKVRRFKVNGGDFVLVSPSLFNENLEYYKYTKDGVIECEIMLTLTAEHQKLLRVEDPERGGEVGTIERLNQLISNPNSEFVKRHKAALTVSFSRPPIDGTHSTGVGRIKKFVFPTIGNVIILPVEYLQQAGIDFDNDKEKVLIPTITDDGLVLDESQLEEKITDLERQYQQFREFHSKLDDLLEDTIDFEDYDTQLEEFRSSKEYQEMFGELVEKYFNSNPDNVETYYSLEKKFMMYSKHVRNRKRSLINVLLTTINEVLLLPELYSEMVLPSSTSTISRIADENAENLLGVPGFSPSTLPKYNEVFEYDRNLDTFDVYISSADLLSIFALDNVASQIIVQQDLTIPEYYQKDNKGRYTRFINPLLIHPDNRGEILKNGQFSVAKRFSNVGEMVQHIRSELVSITVDSTKDPKFADLNINKQNVNTFIFLLYLGYPVKTIVNFLNVASVRKLVGLRKEGWSFENAFAHIMRTDFKYTKKLKSFSAISMDDRTYLDSALKAKLVPETNIWSEEKMLEYGRKNLSDIVNPIEVSDHIRLMAHFIAMEGHASKFNDFKNLFQYDREKVSSLFIILAREDLKSRVIYTGMFSEEQVETTIKNSLISSFNNDDYIKEVIIGLTPLLSQRDVLQTFSMIYNNRKGMNSASSVIMAGILESDFLTFLLFQFGTYTDRDGVTHKLFDYAQKLITKVKRNKFKNQVLLERLNILKNHQNYSEIIGLFDVFTFIDGEISETRIKKNNVFAKQHAYTIKFNISRETPFVVKEGYREQFKRIINGDFTLSSDELKENLINFTKDFFIAGLLQTGFNKSNLSYLEYAPIKFIQSLFVPAVTRFNNAHEQDRATLLYKPNAISFRSLFILNNPSFFRKKTVGVGAQDKTYLAKYYTSEKITLDLILSFDKVSAGSVNEQSFFAKIRKHPIQQNFFDGKWFKRENGVWSKYRTVVPNATAMSMSLTGVRSQSTRSVSGQDEIYTLAKAQNLPDGTITGTIVYMEDLGKDSPTKGQGGFFRITSEFYTPNKQDFDQYEGWKSMWEELSPKFKIGRKDEWKSFRFEPFDISSVVEEAAPTQKEAIPLTENFVRSSVSSDSDYLYLFTDNANRTSGKFNVPVNSEYAKKYGTGLKYPSTTQALLRGLNNAFPITTMVDQNKTQWSDDQFDEYKEIIDDEINTIKEALSNYKGIKFSSQKPFGKGQYSNMKEVAPKIWEYLNEKLKEIGIDNTGNVPVAIPIGNITEKFKMSEAVGTSGGANGADKTFDTEGSRYGVTFRHFFIGKRSEHNAPFGNEEIKEGSVDYEEGQVESAKAANRNYGYAYKTMKDGRLIRNWAQVKYAETIYAVAPIAKVGDILFPNIPKDDRRARAVTVQGGTGYAVSMAILHNKPVYVFDEPTDSWYKWDVATEDFIPTPPPILTKNFAGVGSRNIGKKGIDAIRDLFRRTAEQALPEDTYSEEETPSSGVEISSYSDGIGFALTNPTHTSPKGGVWNRKWTESQKEWREYLSKGITYNNTPYLDVEEAYQENKENHPIGEARDNFMKELIKIKLTTYPKLVEEINKLGGASFLSKSTHQPTKQNTYWETGGSNAFIRILTEAYQEISSSKESPFYDTPPPARPDVTYTQGELFPEQPTTTLGKQQQEAFDNIRNFIDEGGKEYRRMFTLQGYAGTGKTFLTKYILDYLVRNGIPFTLSATTHRAKEVLKEQTNTSAMTLARALGLGPNFDLDDFSAGYKIFGKKRSHKIPTNGVLIIDESSMINDDLFNFITNLVEKVGAKVLFIGDPGQLKPVKQNTASKVFSIADISTLTDIMRTQDGNPLPEFLQLIRDNPLAKTEAYPIKTNMNSKGEGILFTANENTFLTSLGNTFLSDKYKEDLMFVRALAFTNKRVTELNQYIRSKMYGFGTQPFYEGELMMMYENKFFNGFDYLLPNGMDLVITNIQEAVKNVSGIQIPGFVLSVASAKTKSYIMDIFVSLSPGIEYLRILEEAHQKALTTKNEVDWVRYYALDEEVFTLSDYYIYNDRLYVGDVEVKAAFKRTHPNMSSKEIDINVGKLIAKRRTFDYGYAHTIHKAQGGTYKYTYIDKNNIDIAREFKNPDWEFINQLEYVGFSRSSILTVVLSGKTNNAPAEIRKFRVHSFNISLHPDGSMTYENGNPVTDEVTKNKVMIKKELIDGTLRKGFYNNSTYYITTDNRIFGSSKTNLGKETIKDKKIAAEILKNAEPFNNSCQ